MTIDDLGDKLLGDIPYADKRRLIGEQAPLLIASSAEQCAALVERLYQRSVQVRENEQPDKAFEYGRLIRRLGAACRVLGHVALGNMVCGDALNAQNQFKRAWTYLEHAQWRFRHIGDEFGWARTVIGRLWCAIEVGAAQPVLTQEFPSARRIFKAHEDYRRLVLLYLNVGILYRKQANFIKALRMLKTGLKIARNTPEINQGNIPRVLNTIAMVYDGQGDVRRAIHYFHKLYKYLHKIGNPLQISILQNIAYLEKEQGKYAAALKRMDVVLRLVKNDFPRVRHIARRAQIECYLDLNDFQRVLSLARQFLDMPDLPESERASGTVYLARALAELQDYERAQIILNEAQAIYERLEMAGEVARMLLFRGQIALRQADYVLALSEAATILNFFTMQRHQIETASTHLLMAATLWAQGADPTQIQNHCQAALTLAQQSDSPSHIYNAYVLLGHVERVRGEYTEAERNYLSAIAVIDELQRDLTILLRPTFLGDKGEAMRAVIELYLDHNQIERAFETLERSKAQVFFECLADAEALHWTGDETSRTIQRELNQLRADYQGFRNKAQAYSPDSPHYTEAHREVGRIKELILNRTRELYNSQVAVERRALYESASLAEIQTRLSPDSVLIAYYDDGHTIQAFVIGAQWIEHRTLADSRTVAAHMSRLAQQAGIAINELQSVVVDPDGDPLTILADPALNNTRLKSAFNRSAAALYDALIKPLADRVVNIERLLIVPYGQLHFLPFHLLYQTPATPGAAGRYLIEDHEVALLPTASLILREPPKGVPGATILYDDWKGSLRHSRRDAERIHELVGGPPPHEARLIDVERLLQAPPRQVLHVIAHGEFDRDNPELSYVQLADRQLMINDLLQYNLEYELVTLTACEVGQLKLSAFAGRVPTGDDLLGLGRAFLYAGAGTVLVSLWLIGDGLTLPLIERFYTVLRQGATKAVALRSAQLDLVARLPNLHPVFWGVFQLIGDAGTLSVNELSDTLTLSHAT